MQSSESNVRPISTMPKSYKHKCYESAYVDFNFIDSSWVKKGDSFNFIAVQNGKLPERFSFWQEVYYNQTTKVKLYSLGGQEWVY